MKKIFFATSNFSKVKRFSKELLKKNIEIICINDIEANRRIDVEENGKDAIENALIKARAYSEVINIPIIAMDDNLFIDDIPNDLQPGMFVRRVNGKRLNDQEMIEYYAKLAHKYGKNGKLTCRWKYGMALIKDGKESVYTWNKEDFIIVDKPTDKINPGYPLNTISINKKLNKYFTDITEEDKTNLHEDENDVIEFISNNI